MGETEMVELKKPELKEIPKTAKPMNRKEKELYIEGIGRIAEVDTYKKVKTYEFHLHKIHLVDNGFIGISDYCKKCGKPVESQDIGKAFCPKSGKDLEMKDGKVLNTEEIEKLSEIEDRIIIKSTDIGSIIPPEMFNSQETYKIMPKQDYPKKHNYKREENEKNIGTLMQWISLNPEKRLVAYFRNRYGIVEVRDGDLMFYGIFYPSEMVDNKKLPYYEMSQILEQNKMVNMALDNLGSEDIGNLKDTRLERTKEVLFGVEAKASIPEGV